MGNVTFGVLAQQRGGEGEMISAGIAYGFRTDGQGGYVAEGHMHGTQKNLKDFLRWKMTEMAKLRGVEFKKIFYKTQECSIPMDRYGVCIAALIFME
jgi:arginine decarboxylase